MGTPTIAASPPTKVIVAEGVGSGEAFGKPRVIGNARVREELERVLNVLGYREREVFKLLTGLGDGYTYTYHEVARIFKTTPRTIRDIERKVRRKLMQTLDLHELVEQADRERPGIEVFDTISRVKELTPYLISHLKAHEDDLRKLPWQLFEQLVAEFFAGWGFSDVRLVGRNPYTAADVFAVQRLEPSGVRLRYFVEVKRWKSRVGVEVIDRVYGAMHAERQSWGWHVAMIVSLVGFKDTQKYSRHKLQFLGVELRDSDDVVGWLRDYRPSDKGLWLPRPLEHFSGLPHELI